MPFSQRACKSRAISPDPAVPEGVVVRGRFEQTLALYKELVANGPAART
jgi:hypothetical protein